MPLSDREQQILKEIERDLLADDPGLGELEPQPKRGLGQIKGGTLIFVVGIVSLVAFFVSGALALGIVAFVAMVAGVVLITGGIKDEATRNLRDLGVGGRVQGVFGRWEQRLRDRYKRS